jgi:GT2 family glycosyltransferase
MTPHVTIVILNWNGRHLLPACLSALDAQTFRDFEVIVVDNGSQDGSPEWLTAQHPAVCLIQNSTNLGFATANNQGIRTSRAPLVMLLNNDAYLAPDCLQVLVEAAERVAWAGMFACKILQHDTPERLDSAGIEVDRAGMAWNRGWGDLAANHTQVREVFGPSAAAALYRRTMLDQIGLLDDDFFIYYEDVDLAWRAQWAGWRCLCVPEAVVEHVHSATTQRGSPFKRRLLSRNKWWAIAKNYPFSQLWLYVPVMLLIDLAALVVSLIEERNMSALQGRWEALRSWRRFRQKRPDFSKRAHVQRDWYTILGPIHWRQR